MKCIKHNSDELKLRTISVKDATLWVDFFEQKWIWARDTGRKTLARRYRMNYYKHRRALIAAKKKRA